MEDDIKCWLSSRLQCASSSGASWRDHAWSLPFIVVTMDLWRCAEEWLTHHYKKSVNTGRFKSVMDLCKTIIEGHTWRIWIPSCISRHNLTTVSSMTDHPKPSWTMTVLDCHWWHFRDVLITALTCLPRHHLTWIWRGSPCCNQPI